LAISNFDTGFCSAIARKKIATGESPKLLHKMTEAMNQGDISQLRDAAHSLKSTSGAIGANTLAQLSQTLELMTRNGNSAEAPALIAKIETEYRLVKAALEQEIQTS
jgi:HPt (histidine-containing phosphotransfer) domain-containing protein